MLRTWVSVHGRARSPGPSQSSEPPPRRPLSASSASGGLVPDRACPACHGLPLGSASSDEPEPDPVPFWTHHPRVRLRAPFGRLEPTAFGHAHQSVPGRETVTSRTVPPPSLSHRFDPSHVACASMMQYQESCPGCTTAGLLMCATASKAVRHGYLAGLPGPGFIRLGPRVHHHGRTRTDGQQRRPPARALPCQVQMCCVGPRRSMC